MRLLALTFISVLVSACGNTSPAPTPAAPLPPTMQLNLVAFLGDSITARWQPLPVAGAINAGVSGETSQQIAARLQHDVIDRGASSVVILAGTNDILLAPSASVDYVKSMAMQARDAGLRVILCTIPPTDRGEGDSMNRVLEFNSELWIFAQDNAFEIADYFSFMEADYPANTVDEIHPNAAGYAQMVEALNAATDPVPL